MPRVPRPSPLLAGALVAFAGCSKAQCSLDAEMTQRTDFGNVDCGGVGVGQDGGPTDACVLNQLAAGAAFTARYAAQGTDSTVVTGVVAHAQGDVLFLTFDSDPCGGSHCDPTVSEARCVDPTPLPASEVRAPGMPPIQCSSLESHGTVCQ
jgi:hypothetical protein